MGAPNLFQKSLILSSNVKGSFTVTRKLDLAIILSALFTDSGIGDDGC
jgi:hypothetical protein